MIIKESLLQTISPSVIYPVSVDDPIGAKSAFDRVAPVKKFLCESKEGTVSTEELS